MIENNGGRTPVAKSRRLATGQVWVESDGEGPSSKVETTCYGVNQGSRFIIEIPVQQTKELMERWG
jgi:hypothetical protein